ncbi:MAG TPA: hypothetical protein VEL31_09310 [Ktedonobacteraceae bacterium]|nr:hypothetical protein [Ktedonobacteraceae bacterium]
MSMAGRRQERPLTVFGRYVRIACRLQAKRLGIKRYSWTQLAKDSGIDRAVITDGVSGASKPSVEKVWQLVRTLTPPFWLERRICQSLKYCTEREFYESEAAIDQAEKEAQSE